MQAQVTPAASKAPALDKRKIAWGAFVTALQKLQGIEDYDAALRQWGAVQRGYVQLRTSWEGRRPKKSAGPVEGGHDLRLTRYLDAHGHFLNRFWGFEDDAGKRHGSPVPEIQKVMTAYQAAWNYWRKKTKSYAKAKAKENKRRNKLPHVKAKKAAWKESDAGKKWWAEKRAKDKAARKLKSEVLANV